MGRAFDAFDAFELTHALKLSDASKVRVARWHIVQNKNPNLG
jgi:hypothetical protein